MAVSAAPCWCKCWGGVDYAVLPLGVVLSLVKILPVSPTVRPVWGMLVQMVMRRNVLTTLACEVLACRAVWIRTGTLLKPFSVVSRVSASTDCLWGVTLLFV